MPAAPVQPIVPPVAAPVQPIAQVAAPVQVPYEHMIRFFFTIFYFLS